jgi:hypothetical protein
METLKFFLPFLIVGLINIVLTLGSLAALVYLVILILRHFVIL